jgi:DNA-binding SARP family transcriptional activator
MRNEAERRLSCSGRVDLRLLGRFALAVDGESVTVARTGQRVLARVALGGRTEGRTTLAGTLWPAHPDGRAQANLRGALWRLPGSVRAHMVLSTSAVGFDEHWSVDVARAEDLASSCTTRGREPCDGRTAVLGMDLLPDWDETWLVIERERYRQRRLHALEELADSDIRHGRPLDAIDRALACVAVEPLRESAQALVVRAHLAAGNRAAAVASFERFRALLADELAVEPSPELCAMVAGCRPLPHPRTRPPTTQR